MYVNDDEWKDFVQKCRELGLPEDARMDDYLEFLEAFTSEVREAVTMRVRKDLHYDHHNPSMSGPRGPDPDGEEAQGIIDAAVHEELRSCARKLAKLMDGIA
jgi:hypothetical protein